MRRSFAGSIAHAWNIFRNREPTHAESFRGYFGGTSDRPDKQYARTYNKDTLVNSIYNRIATDVASLEFHHVMLNEEKKFKHIIHNSKLSDILTFEANIDQSGRQFIQDIVHSLCDEGFVAAVPTDLDMDPEGGGFKIDSIRVGKIVDWHPTYVTVDLFNESTGLHQQVNVPKRECAIIENPFYATMNEPNSILKRLVTKMEMLDVIDQKNITGKMDIIIQLPYTVKTQKRKDEAAERIAMLEEQMANAQYGIGYVDATEKITQLNRPVDNQLLPQVIELTRMLYDQLGLTKGIFDGTAKEDEILNYYNRTIEPFANAIIDEFKRKFITKTARTRGHSIMVFRNMFKLVPIKELAELADKLIRNEILSSNEFRGIIGFAPKEDGKSDELRNPNLNAKDQITETNQSEMEDQNRRLKKKLKEGSSE